MRFKANLKLIEWIENNEKFQGQISRIRIRPINAVIAIDMCLIEVATSTIR